MTQLNLGKLNAKQREAVLHGNGPLLILAGAGSGKTSTMAYRIAHLIAQRHTPPSAILGLSFTRKAAMELKDRVKKLVKESSNQNLKGLTISTFHSLCVQLLRAHADCLGFQKDFSILDQNDQTDLVTQILKQIKLDDRKFDAAAILFGIGQAKNRFLSGDQANELFLEGAHGYEKMTSDYAIATASTYTRYQEKLRHLNAMDFDDLLFYGVKLLEENPEIRQLYQGKFRHILVDEYQDTNPAQFRLLQALLNPEQNICVVGDDDQSIYAWRGADPTHILEFGRHFPTARCVTLDQNYRSTSTILDAANQVIQGNKNRHPKQLWSDRGQGEPIIQHIVEEDRAEAEAVAEEILRRARTATEGVITQLRPWKDFAVLYRSNPQSRLFEEALRMRQIPYKIVGTLSFLDRKEVKDVLCYWKLVANPKEDASARRILNWPARGIGRTTLEAIHQHSVTHECSFLEALKSTPQVAPRGAVGAEGFLQLIHSLRSELMALPCTPQALSEWGRRSLTKIGAKKAIEEEEADDPAKAARKWDNIEELANSLGQIAIEAPEPQKPSLTGEQEAPGPIINAVDLLREYLTRMTLNALDDEKDESKHDGKETQKDEVTLLTLHGAKGLEFPVVFLVGIEEGYLPHQRTLDEGKDLGEERRLCYVGITRARDQLILTRAKNRIRYGKPIPRYPSRFLQEIPAELLVTQDESLTPDPSNKEAQKAHETKVGDYLASIRAQLQAGSRPNNLRGRN